MPGRRKRARGSPSPTRRIEKDIASWDAVTGALGAPVVISKTYVDPCTVVDVRIEGTVLNTLDQNSAAPFPRFRLWIYVHREGLPSSTSVFTSLADAYSDIRVEDIMYQRAGVLGPLHNDPVVSPAKTYAPATAMVRISDHTRTSRRLKAGDRITVALQANSTSARVEFSGVIQFFCIRT